MKGDEDACREVTGLAQPGEARGRDVARRRGTDEAAWAGRQRDQTGYASAPIAEPPSGTGAVFPAPGRSAPNAGGRWHAVELSHRG